MLNLYYRKSIIATFPLVFMVLLVGCKKFVQIDPPINSLLSANVFNSDATATSAVAGLYSNLASSSGFASGSPTSVTVLSGLSADEFTNFSTTGEIIEFANDGLNSENTTLNSFFWANPYNVIYSSNAIIEGLNTVNGVSAPVKQQLRGEAKFVRAFTYFYLTNLFGDVPLYLTSDYKQNAAATRTPSSEVYQQIISDLKDAQNALSSDYSFSNGKKLRPNKSTATALLARVYLYEQKWDSAEAQATAVINNTTYYSLQSDLDSVFLANSGEAIWQIQQTSDPNIYTNEGNAFILTSAPYYVSLSNYLLNAFEPNDNRQLHWVNSYSDGNTTWFFPFKYKAQASNGPVEYSMVFRLAEQYLIRAEARAEQNTNVLGALADLNVIRSRAGLPSINTNNQDSLLTAIQHERQVELFSEWGHRWFDLIRTGKADAILGVEKPSWKPTSKLYPIPIVEIQENPRISQNEGY